MITYQIQYTACPNCHNRIRGGRRRFGPAQVHCGHCDTTVQTGLTPWASLPKERKTGIAIGEILVPSWISLPGCTGYLLTALVLGGLWMVCALPLALLGSSLTDKAPFFAFVLVMLGFLVWPALMARRLVKMIRESDAYSRDGTVPVWK